MELKHTGMIQMRPHLSIPMSPGRNVEITLDLVPLQTTINATRVRDLTPAHTRPLGKLASGIAAHLSHDMVHVSVRLLRAESVIVLMAERLVLVRTAVGLVVTLLHP